MEFKFHTPPAIGEVLKINNSLTVEGYENNVVDFQKKIGLIIDEMGKRSAIVQGLKSPLTSAKQLAHSDHILYMMIEHNTISPNFTVVGILKMGLKKMLLCDNTGSKSEAMVYCILDFYVHETRQHNGYGRRLIDYMLKDLGLDAKHLAIDKPTTRISNFMRKHYQLSKLVNQDKNIGIYEEFFHEKFYGKDHANGGNRATVDGSYPPTFGRHGAHKHHDTMGLFKMVLL